MKVSVLVTTYNHEKYIAQAINGILMQKVEFEYEIIIGEDCSNDHTREIVIDFQKNYPEKIRTVLPRENLGEGGKRIFIQTIQICQGEYIACMDGDDYWTSPYKLQTQVDFLDKHPECSMCFHNVEVFHEDGSQAPSNFNSADQKHFSTMEDVLQCCFIAACSPLFRRSVLAKIPDWYFELPWGDRPLYILAAEQGKIGYIDNIMAAYRVHNEGMWTGLSEIQRIEGLIKFCCNVNPALGFRYDRMLRRLKSKYYFRLALLYEKQGNISKARSYVLSGIRSWPFINKQIPGKKLLRILLQPNFLRVIRLDQHKS